MPSREEESARSHVSKSQKMRECQLTVREYQRVSEGGSAKGEWVSVKE